MKLQHYVLLVGALPAVIGAAIAQQPMVYPAQGQSPQQQGKDESACRGWAKQNTGIDPVTVGATAPPPVQAQGGQRLRGAAGGAAAGAVVGAVAGDAGRGAAVGAAAGTVGGGVAHRQQRRAATAQNEQNQAAQQQAISTFYRAWGTCMQGRGYTVG